MFEIDLEVAADILDYPVIAPDDIEEGYFGVIHNNKVVASPYYMSEVMPVSAEFFLLTTHARVAAYFHQVRKRPVWICNNVEDFYSLQIPPFCRQRRSLDFDISKGLSDSKTLHRAEHSESAPYVFSWWL